MRLIDADALGVTDFEIVLCGGDYKELCKTLIAKVESAPTIDAVPVVRCKDCRFYRFYDGTFGKGWMCFENNTARHGDDYCSRGERKDSNV